LTSETYLVCNIHEATAYKLRKGEKIQAISLKTIPKNAITFIIFFPLYFKAMNPPKPNPALISMIA
jgi:hypothetical protein